MRKYLALLLSLLLLYALAACGGEGTVSGSTTDMGEVQSNEPAEVLPSLDSEEKPEGGEAEVPDALPPEPSAPTPPSQPPETAGEAESTPAPEESLPEPAVPPENANGILVVYFTYAENAPLAEDVDASSSASIQHWNGKLTGNTGVIADMIAQATGGELFSIQTEEQYPATYDETTEVYMEETRAGIHRELSSHIESLESYDTIFLGFPNWWSGMPTVIFSFLEEYDLSGKTIIPFVTSGGSGFSDAIQDIQDAEPEAVVLDGLSISGSRVTSAEEQVAEWLSDLGFA